MATSDHFHRVTVDDLVYEEDYDDGYHAVPDPSSPGAVMLRISDPYDRVLVHARPDEDENWHLQIWVLPGRAENDFEPVDEHALNLALAVVETEPAHQRTTVRFTGDPQAIKDTREQLQSRAINPDPLGLLSPSGGTPPARDPLPDDVADRQARILLTRRGLAGLLHRIRQERDHASLLDRVPGLVITSAGGMLPFQAEGTWHGYPFYFRYRAGYASLTLARTDGEFFSRPLWWAGCEHGDEWGGSLERAEFADLFCRLGRALVPAKFLYEFPKLYDDGTPVMITRVDPPVPETQGIWADSPEEARTKLADYPYDGLDAYSPDPVALDDRVFPDPAPDFTVREPKAPHHD